MDKRLLKSSPTPTHQLAQKGISVEVIDLRTLSPLDEDSVLESLGKTGLLVVVDESDP